MSKSLGNFFTVRDVAKEFDYEVIRFFMLSAHYRSPINFSKDLMEQSKNGLERIYTCLEKLTFMLESAEGAITEEETAAFENLLKFKQEFTDAMDDDVNTASAISAIFNLVKEVNMTVNGAVSKEYAEKIIALIRELGGVLGLLQKEIKKPVPKEVQDLIDARQKARAEKDFAAADEIRDKLLEMGITLKDTRQGVQIIYNK